MYFNYSKECASLKLNKRKKVIIGILILIVFLYFENNAINVTELDIEFKKLPDNFRGYKILHISDLHSKSFGKNQKRLINTIKKLNPDIIVFTGDLVDSKKYNEEASVALLEQAVKITPVYFVTGNHEWWSGKFDSLEEKLNEVGVKVLRNEKDEIVKNNEKIYILGVDDPDVYSTKYAEGVGFNDNLRGLKEDLSLEDFTILLSHRPERFSLYYAEQIDLIFSGHAHGGQFRIPFIGGVISPNQGFFPKYTQGIYKESNSVMVVTRGLGNSIIPQRLLNRPEVILVTLKK